MRPRARNTHKGDFGSAGIIGGDYGMVGAALLASRAALKLGAGRVYTGLLARDAPLLDLEQPELMIRSADEVLKLEHLSCIAVGPGLGMLTDAAGYLDWALESPLPLVLDADALNLPAGTPGLRPASPRARRRRSSRRIRRKPRGCWGYPPGRCRRTAFRPLRQLAARYNAHVALKGAGTLVCDPAGNWHINTSGNPGMASAGMGDVLTGMIAALLAQGVEAQAALLAAVYLHGAAADALVARGIGPGGADRQRGDRCSARNAQP